jgi:RAB protein geranylgeranyltransferase component A
MNTRHVKRVKRVKREECIRVESKAFFNASDSLIINTPEDNYSHSEGIIYPISQRSRVLNMF